VASWRPNNNFEVKKEILKLKKYIFRYITRLISCDHCIWMAVSIPRQPPADSNWPPGCQNMDEYYHKY
jgi:hypothetical protein